MFRKWMLKEWEKHWQLSGVKVAKNRFHRRAEHRPLQVNPHTVQHARTRAVTSCRRKPDCGVKNNYSSSRSKSRSTVGVIVAPPFSRSTGTNITSVLCNVDNNSRKYSMEMCAILDLEKNFKKSYKECNKTKSSHTRLSRFCCIVTDPFCFI